jgi:CSLREA domain-containing protein
MDTPHDVRTATTPRSAGAPREEYVIMPRPHSAFSFFAATATLMMALAACSDRFSPTRLVAPGSPRKTEVVTAPVVNSLADDGDGTCTDTKCTLRDAIAFASAGATITFSVTGTITLAQGHLAILKNLTISGPGADQLAVDGNLSSREFFVSYAPGTSAQAADVKVSGLTMRNGFDALDPVGGGIKHSGGTLTLTGVTISGNSASLGGGIYNDFNGGVLMITGSTIAGNRATVGGGILIQGGGASRITNSTISGDSAEAGGAGIETGGFLTLANSTVSGNTTVSGMSTDFGGAGLGGHGPTTLLNTIVSNNPQGGNCGGPVTTDGGYNVEDGTTCGFTAATSHSNMDPQLDPAGLVPNGGPTSTIALLSGSPAIDVIPPGTNACGTGITTDQRGVTRPFGAGCDVGAYEANYRGFLPPINNVRTTPIHPGAGVPVQFTLGGFRGLDIFAPGSPNSVRITCPLSAGSGDVLLTDTPGNSGLSYDATTDTYTYVWKTDKAWAGTCRRLVVSFGDGSVRTADFAFVR